MGHSSIGSNRRTMIKIAILVCLAVLAAAEAEAFYGPYEYGYSQGYNWPMYSGNMWSSHHGYSYGKRSAEAEPQGIPGFPRNSGMGGGYWTPSMEALLNPEYTQKLEVFSQQYTNAVANLKVDMDYSKNLDAITRQYNNDVAALNSYNWHKYGKRSAEAEPEADAWFGPYGYSYNMNFMNRPYNYYGYRYYF